MKYLIKHVFLFLIISCSNNPTENKRNDFKDSESELLTVVESYFKSISGVDADYNPVFFGKYISPEYKKYICKEAHSDNFDSVMISSIQLSKNLLDDLKKKGAVINVAKPNVVEKFVDDNLIVSILETKMTLISNEKRKKVTNVDYLLAVSENFGEQWYLYQADIPVIFELLKEQVGYSKSKKILKIIALHQPDSKIEDF